MEATKTLTKVGSEHLGMGIPSLVGVGSGAPENFSILSFEMFHFYAFWTLEQDNNCNHDVTS